MTGNGIGMAFPYPLQPGPLAQRITFWAPVALLFYFFVMLVITTLRKIDLHPINYFFLAASFFSFHLLFAYLVDRIPIEAAFVICSAVTLFLTISYLRLVVGLAVRRGRERARAVNLPDPVLVRAVQRGLERPHDHDRRDRHAVRRHAADRPYPLERTPRGNHQLEPVAQPNLLCARTERRWQSLNVPKCAVI